MVPPLIFSTLSFSSKKLDLTIALTDTFIKYNKARHGDDLNRDWITVHLSWDTYDSGWQEWIQMWSDELDQWSTMIEAEIVSSKVQALRALDRRVKELLEDAQGNQACP